MVAERAALHDEWRSRWDSYVEAHPDLAAELDRRMRGELPEGIDAAFPTFDEKSGAVASRSASQVVINAIASKLPELIGGSADLTGSNLTMVKGASLFTAKTPEGRNFHFGIREHAMGAIMNGVALHGGIIPYGGTFLVFSDYMRPAIRLAAIMGTPVIYVFTHDSIGLGEDGPTHQPIEHLSSLRAIPNLRVLRPGDADEVTEAWRISLRHRTGPSAIVLTRQKLPWFNATERVRANAGRGAYVLKDANERTPRVVLMASGSEVSLALEAQSYLEAQSVPTRVVSVLSQELFMQQSASYRESVLPAGIPRVAVEAAHPMSWYRFVGLRGAVVGLETFGASAPYQTLYRELGLTPENIASAAMRVIGV